MAVLIWIILLFAGLRYILGTEVCSAWLIVGVMVTVAGMGFLLLVKEFVDAVMVPGPLGFPWAGDTGRREKSTCRKPSSADLRNTVDPMSEQTHRRALGLTPRHSDRNRRRSQSPFGGLGRRCFKRDASPAKAAGNARTPHPVCAG